MGSSNGDRLACDKNHCALVEQKDHPIATTALPGVESALSEALRTFPTRREKGMAHKAQGRGLGLQHMACHAPRRTILTSSAHGEPGKHGASTVCCPKLCARWRSAYDCGSGSRRGRPNPRSGPVQSLPAPVRRPRRGGTQARPSQAKRGFEGWRRGSVSEGAFKGMPRSESVFPPRP